MFIDTAIRTSAHDSPAAAPVNRDQLIARLRESLTPRDLRLFGLEEQAEREPQQFAPRTTLLSGLAASASTATLFLVVGFLATLGLPEAGLLASTSAVIA